MLHSLDGSGGVFRTDNELGIIWSCHDVFETLLEDVRFQERLRKHDFQQSGFRSPSVACDQISRVLDIKLDVTLICRREAPTVNGSAIAKTDLHGYTLRPILESRPG